jgi:hypothetical protein
MTIAVHRNQSIAVWAPRQFDLTAKFSQTRRTLPLRDTERVVGQFENSLVVAIHTSHNANKQKTIPMIRK